MNTGVWKQWERRVVNDVFPLRRFLGGSDDSAVFLTEYKAKNLPDVAIKFVPADASQADAQLAWWRAAAKLPHPRLLRLFAVGRCQSAGREFFFVVMEYAEQTLAQVLPQRALSPEEVQEMLPPTLDALAFLHRNRMVHSQLKPSNFLVVNDQLKLASDTLRPAGQAPSGVARASLYDPPELKDSGVSTAGDIWSLGVTLVEALTQRPPTRPVEQHAMASLPASLPAPLVDAVRRCLSPAPANRPSIAELAAHSRPAPQAHSVPDPQPSTSKAPQKTTPPPNSSKRPVLLSAIAVLLLASLAVWGSLHLSGSPRADLQPPAVPVPVASVSAAPAPVPVDPSTVAKPAEPSSELSIPASLPADPPSPPLATTSPSVLHEVTPDVAPAARDKIKGNIHVTLRVLVNPSGDVVGVLMENSGRSKHFARLASDAAREWKFAPVESRGARVWLLRFEFSRNGVATRATAV